MDDNKLYLGLWMTIGLTIVAIATVFWHGINHEYDIMSERGYHQAQVQGTTSTMWVK